MPAIIQARRRNVLHVPSGAPPPIAGSTYWLVEGDSRSVSTGAGFITSGHFYHDLIAGPNGGVVFATAGIEPLIITKNNQAIAGSFLTTPTGGGPSLTARAAADDAFLAANPHYANYVFSIWIGVNDVSPIGDFDGDPNGFLAALATYCDARRAAGWKVVLCTELPAYTGTQRTDYELWRQVVNSGIRSSFLGTHVDAIADIGADPTIGVDGAQLTSYWNADNLHPADSCDVVMAPIVDIALRRVATAVDIDPILTAPTGWDPAKKAAAMTLSGTGNRIATCTTTSGNPSVLSIDYHKTGRRHVEILFGGTVNNVVGLSRPTLNSYADYPGEGVGGPAIGLQDGIGLSWVGDQIPTSGAISWFTEINAMTTTNFGGGNTFMMEVNFELGYIYTGRNGTWDNNNPSTLTNPNYRFAPHSAWYLGAAPVGATNSYTIVASPSWKEPGATPF